MKIQVTHNDRTFNVPRMYFVLCQKVKRRADFADLEENHRIRTERHIQSVKEFSRAFRIRSNTFAGHDADKLDPKSIIYIPDILVCQKYKDKSILSESELLLTELAGFIHVKSNPHHPEYWDGNVTFQHWGRDGVDKDHIPDGSKMSYLSMTEMCCDWCAMSQELGGSPLDWFEQNAGKKWHFADEQCLFIRHQLKTAWR